MISERLLELNDISELRVQAVEPATPQRAADHAVINNGISVKHTTMPKRLQKTPYGDVALTSKWAHDQYYISASGALESLKWLFPKVEMAEQHTACYRHTFKPAPISITVERDLRRVCARWQEAWDERLADHALGDQAVVVHSPIIRTVGELLDHLFEIRKGQVAVSTTERDRYYLKLWRSAIGNDMPLDAICEGVIATARAKIAHATSPVNANCAMGMLKAYLNWAFNKGLLRTADFRTLKRLKEPAGARTARSWWTAAEVVQALDCAARDPHQPTATLLVACGCLLGLRVEEIVMLRWQDLDLDAVDPKTGAPKPVCRITPHGDWQPKDGEARDIPISGQLLAILKEHRRRDGYLLVAESKKLRTRKPAAPWAYRYDPRKVWVRICSLMKAAGGREITMYGMRHSFASNLLIAGVSDVKVARWLGHSDTRMLHKHYGHLLSYDGDINAVAYGKPAAKQDEAPKPVGGGAAVPM